MTRRNLLESERGRALLFTALYFSEGAPIGFVWWTLPALLRQHGVGVAEITTLTATLALPWACKFLWAPAVDALRGPRWDLRHWIAVAQVAMGATLLPLIGADLAASLERTFALLVVHAFAAATQDVAIDALAVEAVPEGERGKINGWMQVGMLSGRALAGGAGLLLAEAAGTDALLLALIVGIWSSLALLTMARPSSERPAVGMTRLRELIAHARLALRRRSTWLGVAFAAIGGAGFESVGAVAGPFLVDRGVSAAEISAFFTVVTVPCMILGALVGGRVADRLGRARAAGWFLLGVAFAVALLAVVDSLAGGSTRVDAGWWRLGALASVYIALGALTTASYALFMELTDTRIAAMQFSAFMALTNVCESWSAFAVGRAVPVFGYALALAGMALLSLTMIPVLARLRRETGDVH